jgi:Asp-tRNA(Asn)/Glu-tRNA(Gln) amidotransferase A subunit family amidase
MELVAAIPSDLESLRAALRSGKIAARAVAQQWLARANRNFGRNVYIELDPERAMREAEALPGLFDQKPPLYGLPISIKDCFDLAGYRTSCGSRFYADRNGVAINDSGVAARLKSQGALIVGKTHLHQIAYGITGENPDYGDCLQPRHPQLLTGGSSSGAAASVQEGSAIAAIGTDTGGSIRVPAALCGLAGYRASIDLAHQMGLWRGGAHLAPSFDTIGWLYRDLRDGPLLGSALFRLEIPDQAQENHVRIGRVHSQFLHDCDPNALAAFEQWLGRFRASGAAIVPFDAGFLEEAPAIYSPIQAHEAAAIHGPLTGNDFSHFDPAIAQRLSWGAGIAEAELKELRERHRAFVERMDGLLSEFDFLILPCAPVSHLMAGADHSKTRGAILRYTTPMSLACVPVVTLPAANGGGVQIAAARGADARLLAYTAGLAMDTDQWME